MTIKIKGTIGSVPIDLEIEGITSELIDHIGQLVANKDTRICDAASKESDAVSSASPSNSDLKMKSTFGKVLIEESTQYIREQGEVTSSELINFLSGKGCLDSEIKRTMMLLREDSDVKTKQGSDFQRVYRLN